MPMEVQLSSKNSKNIGILSSNMAKTHQTPPCRDFKDYDFNPYGPAQRFTINTHPTPAIKGNIKYKV